jgi:hypothetical protein
VQLPGLLGLGLRFPGATHPTAMNVSQREGLGADGIMANDNIEQASEGPFDGGRR